jgi:hypothetical protein
MIVQGTLVLTVLVAALSMGAVDPPGSQPDPKKSRAALEASLARIPGAQRGRISERADIPIERVFPSRHFYVVRFRSYPIKPPEPMDANNLFVVTQDGKVERIEDAKSLEAVLRSAATPITTESLAKEAVRASLILAQELPQDGYLRFSIPEEGLSLKSEKGKRIASGKAVVTEGGTGQVRVDLTFDASGRLLSVKVTDEVKPSGPRPA